MAESDRAARAELRRDRVTLVRTTLGAETADAEIFGAEAISLVHRITLECWSLAGLPVPTYDRASTPIRFVAR